MIRFLDIACVALNREEAINLPLGKMVFQLFPKVWFPKIVIPVGDHIDNELTSVMLVCCWWFMLKSHLECSFS